MTIELRREATFDGFVPALWRAIGVRLIAEMLKKLRGGETLQVGFIQVRDNRVILSKPRFLRSPESVFCGWDNISVWSGNGSFVVGSKTDGKVQGQASYIDAWNTHVLEQLVRAAFKAGADKLSDLM